MSLESLAAQAPLHTRADNPDEKLEKMHKMIMAIEQKPQTTLELAHLIKNSRTLTAKYLDEMAQTQLIERMPGNSYYWQRKDHVYNYDLENGAILDIPPMMFREIPIIKPWYNYAIGNDSRMQYVNTFQAICYGEIVDKFKINPSKWEHTQTTDQFYQAYKEQYGKEYQKHIQKALRAFLTYCLNIQLIAGDHRLQFLGLLTKSSPAKHGYVKLTRDELEKAILWLDSAGEIAQNTGLGHDKLKAHFAFALEGFPRPSRCLTIETERITRYRGAESSIILHWEQPETKQNESYPKFMHDQRLVRWAIDWVDKRRNLNYRYLFVDDNEYQIEQGDSPKLSPLRQPFSACYKALFAHLGKSKDSYFMHDTLYSLRHCGVQLWLERTGYNYDWIAQMGWEDITTLRKFYGAMSSDAMLQFILQGNDTPKAI